MNQRTAGVFLAVILLIALGIVVLWWTQRDKPAAPSQIAAPEAPELEGDEVLADFYFPGNGGRLFVEQRALPASETLEERLSGVWLQVAEVLPLLHPVRFARDAFQGSVSWIAAWDVAYMLVASTALLGWSRRTIRRRLTA